VSFERLHIVLTVMAFIGFAAVVVWAYDGNKRARFAEAARLALEEDAQTEQHEP
jgi:cbb3-type cytochrome oxidase subunit 3